MPPDSPRNKPQEYQKNNPVTANTKEQKLSLAEQAEQMLQQSTQEDEDEEVEHEKEYMTRKTNNTNRVQSLQGTQAPFNTPKSTKDTTSSKTSSVPHDRGTVRRGSSAGIPVGSKGVKMKMVLPRGDPAVALVFSQPEVSSPTSPRPAITITQQDGLEQGEGK